MDRAVVWIDTVKRGPMLRQVRGSGTLVPEDIRWLPAQTSGRVERILLRSGAQVTPDSVILELSNPELTQTVMRSPARLSVGAGGLREPESGAPERLLSQEADTANIEALYKQAALDLEANESLFKEGLISELTLKQKRGATEELKNRLALAQRRLEISRQGVKSQVAPQEADVNQKKTAWELRRKQLEDLKVKAGMEGVLQCVCSNPTTQLERGSSVTPGSNLARVANPSLLKAELRIAETQTKDIRIGQYAEVDTRNGIVKGHVTRMDAASPGRDGRCGREHGWSAAAGRAARSERRWNDSAGKAGQHHQRRTAGIRPGEQHRQHLQGAAQRRGDFHAGQAGPRLGEHD